MALTDVNIRRKDNTKATVKDFFILMSPLDTILQRYINDVGA